MVEQDPLPQGDLSMAENAIIVAHYHDSDGKPFELNERGMEAQIRTLFDKSSGTMCAFTIHLETGHQYYFQMTKGRDASRPLRGTKFCKDSNLVYCLQTRKLKSDIPLPVFIAAARKTIASLAEAVA